MSRYDNIYQQLESAVKGILADYVGKARASEYMEYDDSNTENMLTLTSSILRIVCYDQAKAELGADDYDSIEWRIDELESE